MRPSGDERTDLAWNRSGLAIVGCGLVVMRGLTLNGFERSDVAVGVVILGLGLASYLLAGWHAPATAGSRDAPSGPHDRPTCCRSRSV